MKSLFVLGGAGLAGLVVAGGAACGPAPRPAIVDTQAPVPAAHLGIAPTNSAQANREHLITAVQHSRRHVVFGPGDYLLDNYGPPFIQIQQFGGMLEMQQGARLVLTDPSARGIGFRGGSGAVLRNLTVTVREPPTQRGAGPALGFVQTTDTRVEHATITRAGGFGMLFSECHRPRVDSAMIEHTPADGLHIANCQRADVTDLHIDSTGDDGLAFVNYRARPDLGGGHTATHITVTPSAVRPQADSPW